MKPEIQLPNKKGAGENETIQTESNIVIIGANGAGKTRLGSWIETNLQDQISVHRISAQRALNIPEYATVKNLEQAEKSLFLGRDDQHAVLSNKISSRWGGTPEIYLLNDYDQLLSTLFARTTKRDSEYTKTAKEKGLFIPVPDSEIDIIIRLWKDIMPQREISFVDSKVMAKKEGQAEYHGKGMSDGERVTLYLIGQCLSAPDNSIVIVDEPEIHLHKSLMARLWNKIEEECPNKLLVFITHDLDFASSRKEAKKFWIKEYNGGTSWVWDEIPDVEEIPENLLIEILGNRKNIIFIEGEKSSYDVILYQAAFPDYHIVPRGGCRKVIESTKAMRGTPSLSHLKAYGIIDSDYRTDEEIQALKKAGIYTIDVAEVENLFCIEPLLRIVASNQQLDEDTVVQNVSSHIIKCLKDEFDVQVSSRAESEIQFRLKAYTKQAHSKKGLEDGIVSLLASFDVNSIYARSQTLYEQAINENNLEKALKLYNPKRKNLNEKISEFFGLSKNGYIELLVRLLKSNRKTEIVTAIQQFTPTFE